MKLTWFGSSAFRVHSGGAIVVVEPDAAGASFDRAELVSGADQVVGFGESGMTLASVGWKPRAPLRPLEVEEQNRAPDIVALDADTLIVDADGEAPVVVVRGDMPQLGKWADRAIFVLAGAGLKSRAEGLLERASPRLIALAGDEAEVEQAFLALRDKLDGTGMIALERALAVEV
jgi:hypothetical protein